jgi:hypothetical protein
MNKLTLVGMVVFGSSLLVILGGCAGTPMGNTKVGRGVQSVGAGVSSGVSSLFDRGERVVELGESQVDLIKGAEPNTFTMTLTTTGEVVVARVQDPSYSGFLTDQGKRRNKEVEKILSSLERMEVTSPEYSQQAQRAASLRTQICEVESIAASELNQQMAERVASIDAQAQLLGSAAPASLAQRRSDTVALQEWLGRVAQSYRQAMSSPTLNGMNDLSIPKVAAHSAMASK